MKYSILYSLIKIDKNNNNNKISNNNYLFFKIWKNKILKNKILYHLRKYVLHSVIMVKNCKKLNKYIFREYISTLIIKDDEPIKIKNEYSLPSTITSLKFIKFNRIINKGDIPNSVTSLKFGDYYNQVIDFNNQVLPKSIKNLKFGLNWKQELKKGDLSNLYNLKYLVLDYKYSNDNPLFLNVIPESIEKVNYYLHYSGGGGNDDYGIKSLSDIPESITQIKFNDNFNQELKIGMIKSNTLKSIHFGTGFTNNNKPFQSSLIFPKSIKHLNFNSIILFQQQSSTTTSDILKNDILPKNLKSLIIQDIEIDLKWLLTSDQYNSLVFKSKYLKFKKLLLLKFKKFKITSIIIGSIQFSILYFVLSSILVIFILLFIDESFFGIIDS